MRLFNKAAIVGTGLIGGSIGLGLKKQGLARQVVGVSRHKKTLSLAIKRGAIDKGSRGLNILKDADLLILAAPVKTIIALAPKISRLIRKDCFVTDVGSTKEEIVSVLSKLFPNYVGSHPLAGSEKRSVANAHHGIFKDSLCILTPVKDTDSRALKKINSLWKRLGLRTVLLSPSSHDKILSLVSHLPHIAAFSLINVVPSRYLRFASGGLKDATRIAASDSTLWLDIFLSNQKNTLKAISLLEGQLARIKSSIKKKEPDKLVRILKLAKKKRDSLDDYCH